MYLCKMIEVIQGDITKLKVDAIVNAANSSLLGGGGVDGAIHKAGGPAILEACMKIRANQGGCAVGEAVMTTGGNLPATYVIHTVGPIWQDGNNNEENLLSSAYTNSLNLASQHGIKSIAFPNISTGIYHFPKGKAAKIAITVTKNFLDQPSSIKKIFFVCFDSENFEIYSQLLN